MATIGQVLGTLTDKQRKRLATGRGVTVGGLTRSYSGDWVELMKDMTPAQLARALSHLLNDDELRVVALRAFDGRKTILGRGNSKKRQAEGVVKALCHFAPDKLVAKTWDEVIAKMLRDVGLESDVTPSGLKDKVKLGPVFK